MTAYFAMNAGGALLSAFDDGWQALDVCPDSEPLWYTVSRLSELGFERLPMRGAKPAVSPPAAVCRTLKRLPIILQGLSKKTLDRPTSSLYTHDTRTRPFPYNQEFEKRNSC